MEWKNQSIEATTTSSEHVFEIVASPDYYSRKYGT